MTFNEVSSKTRFRNRITTKSFSLLLLLESQNHGTLIDDVVSSKLIFFFLKLNEV